MPTNENTDYNHGKTYKIVSPNHKKVYYGSTTLKLNVRFNEHKKNRDCSSVEIIDSGDSDIFEIEKFPCSCKEELEDREAYFIMNDWEGCVNKYVPGSIRRAGGIKGYNKKNNSKPENKLKRKEYKKTTKAKIKAKEYSSKPEVKEKAKQKIICDICGCMTTRKHKSTHQKSKKCQKFLNDELYKVINDIIKHIE